MRYLVHTRLDISFVVGYVSRFMEKPRQEHLAAVKHLLCYIVGTVDYGIVYHKFTKGNKLTGYSDSDLGEMWIKKEYYWCNLLPGRDGDLTTVSEIEDSSSLNL